MKILVTGAKGFIGKNLVWNLKQANYEVIEFDKNSESTLKECVSKADFVMHLAGVNRPLSKKEFYDGNTNLTYKLVELLKSDKRNIPLLLSSSIQATKTNDYGQSKKMAEDLVFEYGNHAPVYVYRLANVFGKWSQPNYNSVVATFCYNIANDLEIKVDNPETKIAFVYIDDVCKSFIKCIKKPSTKNYLVVEPIYETTIGNLASLIYKFKTSREDLFVTNQSEGFDKKLYSTYLSYLPKHKFEYSINSNIDSRGSFTELFKSDERGQVSVNIIKPHIIKGQHWHHSKNEKFIVVKGQAVIRFRNVDSLEVIEYFVDGDNIKIIDIPTGYTHNIENVGETDCVCIMWANECYDKNNPDTYSLEV